MSEIIWTDETEPHLWAHADVSVWHLAVFAMPQGWEWSIRDTRLAGKVNHLRTFVGSSKYSSKWQYYRSEEDAKAACEKYLNEVVRVREYRWN